MILEKYDIESVTKYFKELQKHIYHKSKGKIEMAIVLGHPIVEELEIRLLSRNPTKTKILLETALESLEED